jgi:HEPN domain-containing protein
VTREKIFRSAYAHELLRIAQGDLESAEILAAAMSKGRRENICFSVQQAIEKSLKAVLCAQNKAIPLSHSIELLLDRIGPQNQPPYGNTLIELTDYASVKRYEEGNEIITDEDIAATLLAGQNVIAWAHTLIMLLVPPGQTSR